MKLLNVNGGYKVQLGGVNGIIEADATAKQEFVILYLYLLDKQKMFKIIIFYKEDLR